MARFVLWFVVVLAACGTSIASAGCRAGWNDPPAPLPGHVCNELEVVCATTPVSCCPQGYGCGGVEGSVGVRAGECEFMGYEAQRSDAGARRVVPARVP